MNVFRCESIFVGVDDYFVGVQREPNIGLGAAGGCPRVVVVLGILYQFKYKPGLAAIELLCKSVEMLIDIAVIGLSWNKLSH